MQTCEKSIFRKVNLKKENKQVLNMNTANHLNGEKMSKTLQTIQIQRPTELPITAEELENFLRDVQGATIKHPVKQDPVAIKDGKVLAFWTE